jgi:hypothetical protein
MKRTAASGMAGVVTTAARYFSRPVCL